MKNQENVVIKKESHSRAPLSGIYNALGKQGGDPRQRHSGMTSYLMSGLHLTYKKESLNKAYRLGVSPTGAASEPWNNCHKVGNLSGYHPTYEEEALNKGSFRAPLRSGFTLIELLVVVLIIGILAAVAVPQYQKAVEKSKAVQAQAILPPLIQAYQLYYLEHGTYATKFSDLDVEIPWTGKEPPLSLSSASDAVLSNQDWSLQLLFISNKIPVFHILRLTGPYQNSGFAYFFESWGEEKESLWYIPPNSMTCVQQGNSFCTALFKASKKVQVGTAGNYYQMP